jgi:hypothetical protein
MVSHPCHTFLVLLLLLRNLGEECGHAAALVRDLKPLSWKEKGGTEGQEYHTYSIYIYIYIYIYINNRYTCLCVYILYTYIALLRPVNMAAVRLMTYR